MSPADDEDQLVLRRLVTKCAQRIDGVRRSPALELDARTPRSARRRPPRSSHSSSRTLGPGSPSSSLCGGTPTGISSTRSRPSWTCASCAQTRWPRCGGLNVPAEDAERARGSTPDVPVALDHVLVGAQLAQPDRAAGVELLGRVADLGAHAELAAVGEAGRRVDVDAGGVHAALERAGGVVVAGDDRLGVAGAVRVDVLDRLLDGVDDAARRAPARGTRCPSPRRSRPSASAARSPGKRARAAVDAQLDARLAQRAQRRAAGTPAPRRRGRAGSRPRCTRRGAGSWR